MSPRTWKRLINQKYRKANGFIKSGLIDARVGERFAYDRRDSKMYVKLTFEDAADVPLSKVNITEITGNGQVDEILARFFGGPPLEFNQDVKHRLLNGLLGGVEHGAVRGVPDGTKVKNFIVHFTPRRAVEPRRPHVVQVKRRAAEVTP